MSRSEEPGSRRQRGREVAAVGPVLGFFLLACSSPPSSADTVPAPSAAAPDSQRSMAPSDGRVTSNVLRSDYAGSRSCSRCHAQRSAHFQRSPMRNMTRPGGHPSVAAPFDGRALTFKGETARLLERNGRRFMELDSARTGRVIYRVTKVIGGRYREDFAGVPVAGEVPEIPEGSEWILPVSYMIGTDSLRYKGYSVPVKERPGLHVSAQWNASCVFCHNTVPRLTRAWGLLVDRAPGYQANSVDDKLPEDKRWRYVVTDTERFEAVTREEVALLSGRKESSRGEALVRRAISVTQANFRQAHLVELGIGCESCHGGAAEHVEAPSPHLPSFEARSGFLAYEPRDGRRPTRAESINRTCAQCHTVLFSRYPWTWEGGERYMDPGGSVLNSGEARDFLLGGCASQMSCVACHDPHRRDAPSDLKRLRTVEGNGVCTTCHGDYAEAEALAAHTHHPTDGRSSACLNCHMPRKNIGLNSDLTAYHRIGSPTDPERVHNDRPLECALCHVDSSVGELVSAMESWWGRSYDRSRLRELYGADSSLVTFATLSLGRPHEQIIALHMLRESRRSGRAARIASLLTHRIPLVRYHALEALADILGGRPPIDLHQEVGAISRDVQRWMRTRSDRP